MIITLDNLISLFTIPMGLVLENLILALKTPAGFFVSFSAILFVESITFKSIMVDAQKIKRHVISCNIPAFATATSVLGIDNNRVDSVPIPSK